MDQQIVDLESQVPGSILPLLKRDAFSACRLDHCSDGGSDAPTDPSTSEISARDVEQCMALVAILVRSSLGDLNSLFKQIKESRNQKESIKVNDNESNPI